MILASTLGKRWIAGAAAVLFVIGGIAAQPYRVVVVKGGSMSPTYQDNSIELIKQTNSGLYKGEVVVLDSPFGVLIKRVAYLPGENIEQIKIGDKWIDAVHVVTSKRRTRFLKVRAKMVPNDSVYVLGDNGFGSIDSAVFGAVPVKDVIGVVLDQKPNESRYQ
jgi:signal peptidase I